MTIRTVTRRGERRLVIDIVFKQPDGTAGRYRRDAEVQTLAAARAEERRRLAALASSGSPGAAPPVPGAPAAPAAASGAPTFETVVGEYVKRFAPSLKPSTRHNYRVVLDKLLVPRLGARRIDTIDAADVRDLDALLVERNAARSTRRQAQAVLRSVLSRYAVEAKYLDAPPRFPRLPKVGATVKSVLSEDQVKALLAASLPTWRRAFLLAADAGLRAGEIRGLRWSDVDLDKREISVRQAICRGVAAPPKSGHQRSVPLTPALVAELSCTPETQRTGPVSLTSGGAPWGEFGIGLAFKRAARKAGLDKRWRLHDLRHYFVTSLFRTGSSAPTAQALAGHENLSTTQRYAHVGAADRRRAIDNLGATAR